MVKAIAGFFRTRIEGQAAQEALLSSGFGRDEVNFVAGDVREHETPVVGPLASTGAESETGQDAFIGGMAGLAAGTVAAALPGIGTLIAAGPIAGALGGIAVGAAAGGIIGLLRDHGVSEEEAEFYAEGVRRGGSLVTVYPASEEYMTRASQILERHGAIKVEELAEEWRRTGQPGPGEQIRKTA